MAEVMQRRWRGWFICWSDKREARVEPGPAEANAFRMRERGTRGDRAARDRPHGVIEWPVSRVNRAVYPIA